MRSQARKMPLSRFVRLAAAVFALVTAGWAQSLADVLKQGEQVFAKSCATGYCHGARGGPGGAPRLAGRGFSQGFVGNTVTRGVPGTSMRSFADSLSRADLVAVVAYVATLNGIPNPNFGVGGGPPGAAPARPELTGDAARGAQLFKEALRGFGRCSTCHEVGGFGVSVAAPVLKVPADAAALKALATPNVKTATLDGESMPALVLSEGKQRTVFYDLTSAPPVERTVDPGAARFTDGSRWQHSSMIGAYNDSELAAILAYLRAVIRP
jgi:mono/diheme cytochrome c family protein